MTPVVKIVIGGTLLILVSLAVIIPTVVVVSNKNDNGNTATAETTTLTTAIFTSPSQTFSSSTTTRRTADFNTTTMSRTTTTSITITTRTTTTSTRTTTANTSLFSSSYSSNLTDRSQVLCFDNMCNSSSKYYQAFRLNVTVSGSYRIFSQSDMDTLGYLYNQSFDPRYLSMNLITMDDDGNGNFQFLVVVPLATNAAYIFVFTTYGFSITGPYTVFATGPGPMSLIPINISISEVPVFRTDISMSLTNSSSNFCRPIFCVSSSYYYQAFTFNASVNGTYSIGSVSTMDTLGFVYKNFFTPTNSSANLLIYDDDSGGNGQFLLRVALSTGVRYILVVTTFYADILGSAIINFAGPGNCTIIS